MSALERLKLLGCHVSASGGLINVVHTARELGVNTVQIHPTPPQRWNTKPLPKGIEREFLEARGGGIPALVFFHAIYLINLATPDSQKFHLSKTSLATQLEFSSRIQGAGVIVHVGSNKDQPDEEAGFVRAAEGVKWVLEESPANSRLILEVAAGSGKVIGDKLEELARIFELAGAPERVGFALDTQHMWASGYDWQNQLDDIIGEVDRVFGLDKVWAIHLNDSKSALGSHVDRHENLGEGLIGETALRAVVNHPKLLSIPFILETPALKDIEGARQELARLRAYGQCG